MMGARPRGEGILPLFLRGEGILPLFLRGEGILPSYSDDEHGMTWKGEATMASRRKGGTPSPRRLHGLLISRTDP
jgi:hypothetical protein